MSIFAVRFDDLKRKLDAKVDYPFKVERIETCMKGTPLCDTWLETFQADTNTDIHMTVEDDTNTFTFYRIVPKEAKP